MEGCGGVGEWGAHLTIPRHKPRGRIQLVRGNAKEALAAFDEGIANWPNNAGARYLAGAAALQLGDFERAIVEFRESVRVDVTATDAARSLARLYFERGDYEQAINFASVAMKSKFPSQRDKDLMLAARAFAIAPRWKIRHHCIPRR